MRCNISSNTIHSLPQKTHQLTSSKSSLTKKKKTKEGEQNKRCNSASNTWVWDQQLIDKVDNAVGSQDVLVGNDGLPIERQLFPTAAHIQGGSFQCLHRQPSNDGLSTHGWLQDVMVQQVYERSKCLSELEISTLQLLQVFGIMF